MPREGSVFPYFADSYYHVYNRGVDKEEVFFDDKDFYVFRKIVRTKIREMSGSIEISAFALLPNHFHLLLFQKGERDITHFMRSVILRYVLYLKKKYGRTGCLFGSKFQAKYLATNKSLEAARQYILLNPIVAGKSGWEHAGSAI